MKKQTALALVDPKDETEKLKKLFDELFKKTNKNSPKESDVDALRELLKDQEGLNLHDRLAGVMTLAETYLLEVGSPLSAGFNEVLRKKQKIVRQELGFEGASKMEQLLISHVALCWLRLGITDGRRAYNYRRRLNRERRIKMLFRLIEIEPDATGREFVARLRVHEATISRDLKFIRKVKWNFEHGRLGIPGFGLRASGFKFTRGGGYKCVAEIRHGVRIR